MNQDLQKFESLMKTDPDFQKKLVESAQNYTGDKADAQAVFENVILPVAKEYGLSATYEEYASYLKTLEEKDGDLSPEELAQVSGGGKGWGAGLNICVDFGLGLGKFEEGWCIIYGGSDAGICMVKGVEADVDVLPVIDS